MLDTREITAFIKTVPLLSGLPEASISNLAVTCRTKEVSKGYIIFSRGDSADIFYIIYSGLTSEFVSSRLSEVEIFIKERRPGDYFGEMGILLNEPATVTEIAVRDSVLLMIRREIFLKLVDQEPYVANFLMRAFAQRVKASGEQQITSTLLPAPSRLAYIVLRLEQEEGNQGIISQTQDYLAQRSGLARQTVARILGEWQVNKWVTTHRGWLEVKNRSSISQILEADDKFK